MNDLLGLAGKTAIVTGAGSQASGIGNGRATAAMLAQAGANVVLVDAIAERLKETATLVTESGAESLALEADVASEEDCRRIVAATVERFGGVDVLVNNVGIIGPAGSVVDIDMAEWDRTFRVNVSSMVMLSKFVIPEMCRSGRGSIVNVSSLAGVLSHPRPAYAASKGAVISLTRSMAMTHGPEGIRVNAVAPGMVYTPNVWVEGMSDQARKDRAAATPLGTEGTGWDVAKAIIFLCSDMSSWVSGVCVNVDGGFSADLRISPAMGLSPSPR